MQLQQKITSNIILTPQLTAVTEPQSSVLNDEVFKIFVITFYVHLEKHEACHRDMHNEDSHFLECDATCLDD
jgi:hypothetical protein